MLVALGESMTGDRETARDAAQEAFVRLHHNWSAVSQYDNPGGWLRRVMSNLLIDRHRSRESERRAVVQLASPVDRANDSPGSLLGDHDLWSSLLAGLPPRQRIIVALRYGDDLPVADIADMLDVSPNTVKSALSKARDTLRDHTEASA